jgi:hypothetical protein
MFTFPILAVRKVVDRGISDAALNGGFRNPYYGTRPGEGEKPGIWLVGDLFRAMPSGRQSRLVGLQAPPLRRR